MRFWKVQAIGNDFPILDLADVNGYPGLNELAVAMADRRFGIGGDGLLAMGRDEDGTPRLRMFNPDGTEDFCGNGLRAAAWWAFQTWSSGPSFEIRHLDRTVGVRINGERIATVLGQASYAPAAVPHTAAEELFDTEIVSIFRGSSLTTGSTHTVLWPDSLPESPDFERVSAGLEVDDRFPMRTSVIWAVPDGREDSIRIRIWERGVGETLGCGTGSTAAAADWMRRRGQGGTIQVANRGGTVEVAAESWDAPLTISGEAEIVYAGEWPYDSTR